METNFTLKVNKAISFEVILTFSLYSGSETFSAYIRHEDFNGSLFNGHLNYNKKGIVLYDLPKQFEFFKNEIESATVKILKKYKIVKK